MTKATQGKGAPAGRALDRIRFVEPVVRVTRIGRELLLSSSEREIRRTGGRALSKSEKRIAATVRHEKP